jgi:hypothetical protein
MEIQIRYHFLPDANGKSIKIAHLGSCNYETHPGGYGLGEYSLGLPKEYVDSVKEEFGLSDNDNVEVKRCGLCKCDSIYVNGEYRTRSFEDSPEELVQQSIRLAKAQK